ncbi:MAG: transporter [Flavobacteriia bacterium]|nr:MAG: transporter [Flavobacteriia bacterium]
MKILYSFLLGLMLVFPVFAQTASKQWTLEDCVKYALDNNLSVKQSEYNIALQETEVQQAKNQFLPTVSGSSSLGLGFGRPDLNTSFSNSFGISASSVFYNGGRTRYAVERAGKQLEISHLETEVLKNDLAVQVVNAYLNVLYNREGVRIAEDQVTVSQQLLDRMKELVDAGVSARNDLYQAEANLARHEESLVTATNNLEVALLSLAQLLQLPYDNFDIAAVDVSIDEAKMAYGNSDVIYDKALDWRPEIMSAQKRIENADIVIKSAKAGMRPTVSGSYSFGTNYFLDLETEIQQKGYFDQLKDGRGHNLAVSLSIPIFDRFNTRLSTQRSNIQRDIAVNNLDNKKLALRTEIERAYLDAKTSLKTLEAAEKTVEAQEEAFRVAQEKFNFGAMTTYDFEQVRNQLVQAQSSYIRAKYNYIFKTKFLEIYYGLPVTLD